MVPYHREPWAGKSTLVEKVAGEIEGVVYVSILEEGDPYTGAWECTRRRAQHSGSDTVMEEVN